MSLIHILICISLFLITSYIQVDLQSLVSGEEQRFSIATARHALSLCQFNAFVAELIEEKDLLMSRLKGLGPHQMSKYGDE